VVTSQLRPEYLRKNGPPYSGNTVLKEFFDLSVERNGGSLVRGDDHCGGSAESDRAVRNQY